MKGYGGDILTHRDELPYLMQVVDGRAVVLDYAVRQGDGRWHLASAPSQSYATRADVLALAHATGTEWRTESLQFNPYANLPVDQIGVRFIDGQAIDYTVKVTDRDGSFYVWARNLDRALELQWKTGDARAFNLRNYAVDFAHLDEVGSTDDSQTRVELLTPAQFHFATSLSSIDFRPEMLTAAVDATTGHIDYSVNDTGSPSLSTTSYVSAIKTMIELVGTIMSQYVLTSRRMAVRLALQGGLKDFARGIEYNAATDTYAPTTDRQLAPLFEAIFAAAPGSNANDAVLDYLTQWNLLLWQIYPDYAPKGTGNLLGAAVAIDQAFIFQMMIEAFETTPVALDIRGVAHALSVDETRIITNGVDDATVAGTAGTDFFYITPGDHVISGGRGADYYFIGKNAGNDTIVDYGNGENDELVFTDINAADIVATRVGQDLLLQARGRTNVIRIRDQFLGELNDYFSNAHQGTSGVNSIVFADGVIWDRFRMAFMVAHPADTNDSILGSGSADVIWGGKGNDYLSGGAGGDIYVWQRGDGQDVIDDQGAFSLGAVKAGLDFLMFKGDISADDLMLYRDGSSDDLRIVILDHGIATTDSILIKGMFGGVTPNLQSVVSVMRTSAANDNSPRYPDCKVGVKRTRHLVRIGAAIRTSASLLACQELLPQKISVRRRDATKADRGIAA